MDEFTHTANLYLQLELATVGASYASALVEAAEQKGLLEAIHADVDTLSSLMKEDEVCRHVQNEKL